MGLLNQREAIGRANNKCGRCILEDVHRCPNLVLNWKSNTVSAAKKRGK